ncbi:hypothetical protein ENUP19_0149G0011 [Entamoeba nuttalli]|uniref:Pumilio family RNA-binding protein n=2 Tax=Entamoeba nuttalli TaxID=412467 RepID=K2HY39_ENTNP|nr:pumilio family RNA-binding protein [Entamoeba nuttalli P19]EKE41250.1 pumilio family RNA-binding protein [Entamoeba nuttalli P19]|eukprot:XP_008856414.1 pumilio family RNA-binding protein [Entamoeba nuttalli P19]
MPYTEQGYKPKQRKHKDTSKSDHEKPHQNTHQKSQQNKNKSGIKRQNNSKYTQPLKQRSNPFGAKVSDELKKEYQEKKQRKESNEDAINQMKFLINSHSNTHKKWSAGEIEQLITLSRSSMYELSIKPDASRIIQTIIKNGDNEQRQTVLTELKPKIFDLTKDQYGHHVVKKLLKYCSKIVPSLLLELYHTHIFEMLMQKFSSDVLKTLCEFINKTQQRKLIEEVYGAQYEFLKSKNPELKTFSEVINSNDTLKNVICKDLKDKVFKILNKQHVSTNPLLAQLLIDYISCVDEKDASEVAASLREHLQQFLTLPEGPKLMKFVIIHSSAKARKGLLKECKENLITLMTDKFGHYCILYLLRHVDDKMALKKYVLDSIEAMTQKLVFDKCGIELLEFILDPLSTHFLPPSIIDPLKEKGSFTLKDDDIRFKDMLTELKPTLLDICQKEYKSLTKFKPTRRFLTAVKKSFPEETTFIIDEDLKGKKVGEENKAEEIQEEKPKEPSQPLPVETDAVMKGEEVDDIKEIKKEVAEAKAEKAKEMKKKVNKKGYSK